MMKMPTKATVTATSAHARKLHLERASGEASLRSLKTRSGYRTKSPQTLANWQLRITRTNMSGIPSAWSRLGW